MGPGNIFDVVINKKLDNPMDNVERNHPISIKGYKYNGLFNPQTSSTCPCMPKYHCSFGRPRHFEGENETKER